MPMGCLEYRLCMHPCTCCWGSVTLNPVDIISDLLPHAMETIIVTYKLVGVVVNTM